MGDHPAGGNSQGGQVAGGESMNSAGMVSKVDEKIRAVLVQAVRDLGIRESEQSTAVIVLGDRLLPLLLAGQAMRERLDYQQALPLDIQIREQWDTALAILAAAQGQPEKESGR